MTATETAETKPAPFPSGFGWTGSAPGNLTFCITVRPCPYIRLGQAWEDSRGVLYIDTVAYAAILDAVSNPRTRTRGRMNRRRYGI